MAVASAVVQCIVSPLLETVFDNLTSLIRSEFGLVRGVNGELEKLSSTLSTIRDVIEDAEEKQLKDKPINNWLRKLKDVSYDADDVLDEFATETAALGTLGSQSKRTETNSTSCSNIIHEVIFNNSISSCFNSKEYFVRRSIAKRIKELRQKFDEIAKERSNFHLNLSLTTRDVESGVQRRRQTSSFLVEPQVYGREEEKEYIVNLLINETRVDDASDGPRGGDVKVCAVLGMGGLGKTTLAQMVHHDERIVKHFEVRCWVCVSENFEPQTLFKAILESLGGEKAYDLVNLDPLQHRLHQMLSGKRFLVVLDDVWNEDQAKWEIVKSSLRFGRKGSSVIVTTRLQTAASMMATLPVCHLDVLSENHCWSLFKNRSFDVVDKEEIPPNLEAIGKEIVKKCGGIPLAAKALGGLLRFKRLENEWLFVRDNDIWDLPQDNEDAILPALRLSYNHLPSHLRQCFSFCSIFPKDYKIGREELVHLWMANGFIQSKGGRMETEDVGNEIFNELSWRSFFQDFGKDEYGNILHFKMHDLVHDLACSIMRDECLVMEVGKTNTVRSVSTSTRHLSLDLENHLWSSEFSFPKSSPHVRSLLLLNSYKHLVHRRPLLLIFSSLTCLRVLDLNRTAISTVPASIGNLKHLRYINLSNTNITLLPNESFCTLITLQILRLQYCRMLQHLPEDMRKLTNLRHLDIEGCSALSRMPEGMGKLIRLQTLTDFVLDAESGCCITELKELDHLRGGLEIKGLEHVRSSIDVENASLMKKQNLHSLKLCWSTASQLQQNNSTTEEDEKVLVMVGESLQPHSNVKMLHIGGFGGTKLPSWVVLCLPNLVEISLRNCGKCKQLPSLGKLPFLKILKMSGMNSVKCISHEFYHGENHHLHQQVSFPSLLILHIVNMPKLEEFSSPSSSSTTSESSNQLEKMIRVFEFPCLREFSINLCPKLRRMASFPASLKNLDISNCHEPVLSTLLKNLPLSLSDLSIGVSDEMITFPVVEGTMWMRLRDLTDLSIGPCSKLKTLPKELMENLTALTRLRITCCDELIYLPEGMQHLKSLKSLNIECCPSLKSVHEGIRHLTTLEELLIVDCPELEFLKEIEDGFQHLISLRTLNLDHLPKMRSLPPVVVEGTQHHLTAPTLEFLFINACSGLTSLPEWMPNLTSLRHLDILSCQNLKFLPDGLQRLTALQKLRIQECNPLLHRRCDKDTGDDWHKISHIPRLINNRQMQ